MTTQEKATALLEKARALAPTASSWVDFSNQLFDPNRGLVAKTFPRSKERRAFYDMPEYEELNAILLALIKRSGGVGAAPKSGKFIVRIPKTLHTVLDVEAEQEGISLNQLALTKLSVNLGTATSADVRLMEQAFRAVHGGYSSDWVLVHPELNPRFLKKCRSLGVQESDFDLNHKLLDMRKSGKGNLPPTTKRPAIIKNFTEFAFASEIAFRYLQRRDGVSMDRVLCDPELRERFDAIAMRLAPGQSALIFRWAALYLRKMHRLSPKAAGAPEYDLAPAGPLLRLDLGRVPTFPGVYAFYHDVRPIYVSESELLRDRIKRHAEASDKLGLPTWLELGCESELILKFYSAPSLNKDDRMSWVNRFINREMPLLNYQQASRRGARKAG